jgi:chaperonin cofactor prefoldin
MKAVRSRYLGKTIADFDNLWGNSGIHFRNKTHTWRKLYGSYSNQLFNKDGNLNLWLMDSLGHVRIETSFSYANVVVTQGVQIKDENLAVEYSRLKADYADIVEKMDEMQKQIKFLMNRSFQPTERKEEGDEEMEFLVAIPRSLEESTVNVKPFDISNKKFKKDEFEEKKQWIDEYTKTVHDRLIENEVAMSKLNEDDFRRLNVSREVGRSIVKEFRNRE